MTIQEKLKETWEKACRFDGISPEAKFVVFSSENPFVKEHAKWVKMYFAAIRLR